MFMDFYQFTFDTATQEQKDLIIALLQDEGFNGFEEEQNSISAYISETDFKEVLFKKIIEENNLIFRKSIIKNKNWNSVWEADFSPILVSHPETGKRWLNIRAAFHPENPEVVYDLVITPKMSFGTGHHATTYQMVQQMALLDFSNKSVIDFGTGTGILAILAEKLGASAITAIDNDDWSIENTRENIEKNGCSRIHILKAETIDAGFTADIILANINLNIIIANLGAIKKACNTGSSILFSGILASDEEAIISRIKEAGLSVCSINVRDNWLIILAKR